MYILHSVSTSKYYIGSIEKLQARVAQYNDPLNPKYKNAGRFKGPWKLVYSEPYEKRSDAMKRENQVKSWKNKHSIDRLIANRSIESRQSLKSNYKKD